MTPSLKATRATRRLAARPVLLLVLLLAALLVTPLVTLVTARLAPRVGLVLPGWTTAWAQPPAAAPPRQSGPAAEPGRAPDIEAEDLEAEDVEADDLEPQGPGDEAEEPGGPSAAEDGGEAGEEEAPEAAIWEPLPEQAYGEGEEPLNVESGGLIATDIGSGTLVTLPEGVERVALANPAIGRVQIISGRELLVTGLLPGRTTLFIWLTDGRRLRYVFQAERNLEALRTVMTNLDPGISVEASADGSSVLLSGEVSNGQTAETAEVLADRLLRAGGTRRRAQVVNLLSFPTSTTARDLWLTDALQSIDPRIRVRRIQVGAEAQAGLDSYILEGRVKNLKSLVRAVILAERQLGSTGVGVSSPDRDITGQRNTFFGGVDNVNQGQQRVGLARPPSGLAAQVARGLIITSESGRVLSLLEVDELPQVLVSIRVYQIDRGKAKKAGINFRFDSEKLSFGSFTGPQTDGLPRFFESVPDVTGIGGGSLVTSFVNDSLAIAAAIDWLQEKNLARSVAEPNVLTLSGEEASVLVGGEVPIPITNVSQVTTVQGFLFQDFGISMSLRPTVDADGIVSLEVSPRIIRPDPGLSVGGVPGFQVQSVQTTARVPAGQSLVLGGLLSFDETLEESRVPVLGKIPLFRWRRKSREEQELIFVITPRLVSLPPEGPDEPIDPPKAEEIELPGLEWPEYRDGWKEEFEPRLLPPDGLPDTFRTELVEPEPENPTKVPAAPRRNAPLYEEYEPTPATEKEGSYLFAPQDYISGAEEENPPEEAEPQSAAAPAMEPTMEPGTEPAPGTGETRIIAGEASPCLNLRPQPSIWCTPVDCLAPGLRVELLELRNGWWNVRLPDGRTGWVAARYLAPDGETVVPPGGMPPAGAPGTVSPPP